MSVQIGVIDFFASGSVPVGWLLCDGRSVEVNLFPDLFAAIGTQFGGDGDTYFALPDMTGHFSVSQTVAAIAYQRVEPNLAAETTNAWTS